MNRNRSESGQAIVFIAIALVAMFGFVGLAVDGGRVYSEQRRAQNAADAAAYAAAMAAIEGEDPYQAALSQAAANEFNDTDTGEDADLPVDVIVNNPPTHGQYAGDDEYYEVIVRARVDGSFSRVVMINELPVEAYAVVHAKTSEKSMGENAIHALDPDDTAMEFKGFADVHVKGGNIMSNGAIEKRGSSGDILVEEGGIYYVDGTADDWLGDVSPAPEKVPNPVFVPSVPEPDCGTVHREAPEVKKGDKVFKPGIYDDTIQINAHDNVIFEPGMYCLMNGIRDNGNSKTVGRGVMFVLYGGHFHFNGNSDINLTRPNDLVDPSGNQWGGMLVYVPPSYQGAEIDVTGNNGTTFAGTIFAPGGTCRVGGNADLLGIKSNIVCYHILFHGNPTINIDYKAAQNFHLPPFLELSE